FRRNSSSWVKSYLNLDQITFITCREAEETNSGGTSNDTCCSTRTTTISILLSGGITPRSGFTTRPIITAHGSRRRQGDRCCFNSKIPVEFFPFTMLACQPREGSHRVRWGCTTLLRSGTGAHRGVR